MLNQYQNEIIATIAILTAISIYIIIKLRTKDQAQGTDETLKHQTDPEPSLESQKEIIDEKFNINEETNEVGLAGSEEGDFGKEESEVQNITRDRVAIPKRDVVKHGKITKHNFSEFSGERILVAEDNLINQKVLTGLLAGSGIEVIIANDGQEALNILQNDTNFLMILMDAHMPILDGFEATREIRKEEKYDHILVVALSGDTAADDIKKMREAGMQEQLEKPLRMRSLYETFYAYTGNRSSKNEYRDIVMTQELNGDKGLEICGGDEEFYIEILNEFIQTYENSSQKLADLLREGKLEEADKFLLDILGITANIGAEALHQLANDIKLSLNDREEKSYFTLLDQYKVHLTNLIKDIKEYKK